MPVFQGESVEAPKRVFGGELIQGAPERDTVDVDTSPTQFNDLQQKVVQGLMQALEYAPPVVAVQGVPQEDKITPTRIAARYLNRTYEEAKQLAAKGIDVMSGSPVGRIPAQFAVNEQTAAEFYKKRLTEHFGTNVDVRINEGELEYLKPDPVTNRSRWARIDESNLTISDITEMLADTVVFGMDAVGSLLGFLVGGAVTGGTPAGAMAGEATGSFAGTYAGEMGRLQIGEWLDVNPDMTLSQLHEFAKGKGQDAATGVLLSNIVMRVGKRLFHGATPKIGEAEADALIEMGEESSAIVSEINRRTSQDFDVSVPELVDDPLLLAKQAELRQNREIELVERNRHEGNQAALSEYYDVAFGPRKTKYEAGTEVKQKMLQLPEDRLRRVEEVSTKDKNVMLSELDKVPGLDKSIASEEMRQAIITQKQAWDNFENIAWERYKKLAGFSEDGTSSAIQIPRSEILNKTISKLSKETRQALFEGEAKGKKALISKLVKKEEDGLSLLGPDGEGLLKITPDEKEMDLAQITASLKYLRHVIRTKTRGEKIDDPTLPDVIRMKNALQKTRDDYLAENHPDILSEVKTAEAITRNNKDTFDRSIVGDALVESAPGKYKLRDGELWDAVIKSQNTQASKEMAGVLIEDPRAMQAMREHIYSFYASKTKNKKTGLISPEAHKKFMDEYGDTIKPFFTLSDDKRIQIMGEMAKVVEKRGEQVAKMEAVFKDSFRGKIKDLNPESIIDALLSPARSVKGRTSLSIEDASTLKHFAKSNGSYDSLVSATMNELRKRTMKGGVFDYEAFSLLLDKQGDNLMMFLPDQYVRDLRTFKKALEITSRQRAAPPKAGESRLIEVFRAYLGPLHPRQRLIRAGKKINASSADAALYNAISDPETLHQLTRNLDKKVSSRQVVNFLASVGSVNLLEEE